MQTPDCGYLHRRLSQPWPLQQHSGPSRTVRRYPATGANGQLMSNALPSGLELRDSSPQAAHVNHLSPPWGKAGPGRAEHPNRTHSCPTSAHPFTIGALGCHLVLHFFSQPMDSICALALCQIPGSQINPSGHGFYRDPGTLTTVCHLLRCHLCGSSLPSYPAGGPQFLDPHTSTLCFLQAPIGTLTPTPPPCLSLKQMNSQVPGPG